MDAVTKFLYSIGSGNEIITGRTNPLDVAETPSELIKTLTENEKGIIVPKFIGVYQMREVVTHIGQEQKAARRKIAAFTKLEQALDIVSNRHIFEKFATEDNAHPNLIFVAYNSELWTSSLVRESLGNTINRIVIAPYTELPKFSEKDITIAEQILSKGQEIYGEIRDKAIVFKALTPELSAFRDQAMLYGLTRQEYAILEILNSSLDSPALIRSQDLREAINDIDPDRLRT